MPNLNRNARLCVWWPGDPSLNRSRRAGLTLALAFAGCLLAMTPVTARAQATVLPAGFIVMASTTSTEQSGLFGHLLPLVKAATGVEVRVVALGTGQALDSARRGDADIVFVHDQPAEEKFVADGFGLARLPVMYNDFVLVGPTADPAAVRGADVMSAMKKLASAAAPFVSRGDKSGTHAAELRLWRAADATPPATPAGAYKECGCGMGPALNMASSLNAYLLADRGTWANFKNRGDLVVLVQGDPRLHNPYGVIVVNPARHPHVKRAQAQAVADWLVSAPGQAAIAGFRVAGEQVFFAHIKR
jgi:tungstate transport system substrate-binding protein